MLGLAVGSFLNVVIWRVPRALSTVSPRSSCPRCGAAITSRDNVPLLSWLVLRGRCRDCKAPISARYPLVELSTAAAFAALAIYLGDALELLPVYLYLAALTIALTLIDIEHHRLPDRIVLPALVVTPALLAVASFDPVPWDGGALVRALIGGAALSAAYFLMMIAYPQGMGFGDVKLAGVLGMFLAWHGWAQLLVGAFASFVLGGLFALVLLLVGRAGRRSKVPFGPWMLLGSWVGVLAGEGLGSWYLNLVGL